MLELGCGAGRILCALAQPKRALYGLDWDPSLLRLGRKAVSALPAKKRGQVVLVRGDMRGFELGRRFERVILPYNALYCLLSTRDLERCFRAAHRALEPGGLFGFDVWNADSLDVDNLSPVQDEEELVRFDHANRSWSVFERCRAGRGAQRLDVTYTYVPSSRGRPRNQLLSQRYYCSPELFASLAKAGFEVQAKLGNFAGARFNQRATRLVVSAKALG